MKKALLNLQKTMANYKNRKPKSYKGCCRMCALGDSNGCRNGRRLTRQEIQQRDRESDEYYEPDIYDGQYDLFDSDFDGWCDMSDIKDPVRAFFNQVRSEELHELAQQVVNRLKLNPNPRNETIEQWADRIARESLGMNEL